ncbi:MAG: crotonase/enoyl-CoA hydratase family protein [Novosphingobium sp.]
MNDLVLYEADGPIVTLTLNRPELHNAISDDDMIDAILASLVRLENDRDARVAILTGTGRSFSSGGNLNKMGKSAGINDPLPARTRINYRRGIQRLPMAFADLEIPIIAAVNGPAIGAGCDLACMCDLRIAAKRARFAESFVKIGIVPGDGGAWLLPQVIGIAKASEMALTGDPVGAEEALAIGLVSKVVADEDLLVEAKVLADRIAVNPPYATRMTKRLLWHARSSSLVSVLEMSASMQALAHATDDHDEAIAAMLEKRSAKFSGK